jgi:nicotinamidase-related amidase
VADGGPAPNGPTMSRPDTIELKAAETALLLIDVVNDLEFSGGEELLRYALPMAESLAKLKRRAKACGVPVIYANDNFGRWRSDFPKLVKRCLASGVRGRPIVARLQPDADDYFVLKPKHSAFFQTNLEILLRHLKTRTLILTGMAADYCVLFTANDGYMRDFRILVPQDCIASEELARTREVLALIERVLKADTRPSEALAFKKTARSRQPTTQAENFLASE